MRIFADNWPKRPLVVLSGGLLLALGTLLLVLPGPGFLLMAAGLSLLGAEYAWARRSTRRFRDYLRDRGW